MMSYISENIRHQKSNCNENFHEIVYIYENKDDSLVIEKQAVTRIYRERKTDILELQIISNCSSLRK